MHRRARHLNARDAGATMVLDARFISGSDGDAIGTWSSRTSSTYDMTQSTASYKPLLKLGANGINGQATVLFDGTNDRMDGANENVSSLTIFAVARQSGANTFRVISGRSNTSNYAREYQLGAYNYPPYPDYIEMSNRDASNGAGAYNNDFTTGFHLCCGTLNSSQTTISVDGKAATTGTVLTGQADRPWNLGYLNDGPSGPSSFFDDKISAVFLFKNQVATSSVIKRINHSLGFSFKIACS